MCPIRRVPNGDHSVSGHLPKIMVQGGHVTPFIESNPLTACTRNWNQRNLAEECSEKKYINYRYLYRIMQLIYKVKMHKSGVGREFVPGGSLGPGLTVSAEILTLRGMGADRHGEVGAMTVPRVRRIGDRGR